MHFVDNEDSQIIPQISSPPLCITLPDSPQNLHSIYHVIQATYKLLNDKQPHSPEKNMQCWPD